VSSVCTQPVASSSKQPASCMRCHIRISGTQIWHSLLSTNWSWPHSRREGRMKEKGKEINEWHKEYRKEGRDNRCNEEMSIIYFNECLLGRSSVGGVATRHALDGPGIEFRWGRDFPKSSRPDLETTQLLIKRVLGLFLVGKAAGVWRWSPTSI
jgi:hypothetical protein